MISVLLSVYKEKNDYINQSILSILNQTYGDFELIIIIDNPSNEDAISLIKDLASKDKRIHFYINEENMGLVKSLNRALSYAKGEYIARMDADDMSMPNRFEICKEYLENNNLDLIGGVYEHMDEEGHVVPNSRTYGYSPSQVEKIIKYTNIIPHPTWFGKKEVFDSLNGYRLVKYAEDYDFLLRACEKGYRLGVIDEKVLNYRINTTGISWSNLYKQFLVSRYLSKNHEKLNELSMEDINERSLDKYSEKKEKKYVRSEKLFLEARNQGKVKKLFSLLKAYFGSSDYRYKMGLMMKKRKDMKRA